MNLNSPPPSPFPIQHQICHGDTDQPYDPLLPPAAHVSCHIFFNSAQDHVGYYNHDQIYHPQHASDDYPHGYNHGYEIKNKVVDQSGQLKLTLWKKQDRDGHDQENNNNNNNHHPVKWMPSKMRLMQKMKNHPGRVTLKITGAAKNKTAELASDSLSSNSSSYTDNNSSPIRVCSDCNTTKTPLWRSGPKGPKSLCNACGIRQRKARRAMAAAAAAANGTTYNIQPSPASMKIKVQHKGKNGHLKKRCKTGTNDATNTSEAGSSSSGQKKIGFEDFLINLSKNLSFHRVFPEDEKDAAILLMALSSGLVHG